MPIITRLRINLQEEADKVLATLNPEQRDAVEDADRPVLVLAPAGTGKTHVLAARYMLLRARGILPTQILALTFTRRAAQEMRNRILPALHGYTEHDAYIDTFHGIGLRMLRSMSQAVGLRSGFRVLDETDQQTLMHEAAIKCDRRSFHTADHEHRRILDLLLMLERIKTEGVRPADLVPGETAISGRIYTEADHAVLTTYEHIKQQDNAVDYADLLLMPYLQIKAGAYDAMQWTEAFRAILVDEYQDCNTIQYKLLRELARTPSVLLLGDDDQVLYSWRGADTRLITHFEDDWPEGITRTLKRNYRNAPNIIRHARDLITRNQNRRPKRVQAVFQTTGTIIHQPFDTQAEEEAYLAHFLSDQLRTLKPEHIAVLTRTKARAAELALILKARGIPCWYPDTTLLESREALALAAWSRLILTDEDSRAAERALAWPDTRLNPDHLIDLRDDRRDRGVAFLPMCRERLQRGEFHPDGVIAQFLRRVDAVRTLDRTSPRLFRLVADTAGLAAAASRHSSAAEEQLERAITLYTGLLQSIQNLEDTLDTITLSATSALEAIEGPNRIRVDTMHSAKGLEYETVVAPGWDEGEFPRKTTRPQELDEERRIAYVTLTRARRHFLVTSCRNRPSQPRLVPSRFISELGLT